MSKAAMRDSFLEFNTGDVDKSDPRAMFYQIAQWIISLNNHITSHKEEQNLRMDKIANKLDRVFEKMDGFKEELHGIRVEFSEKANAEHEKLHSRISKLEIQQLKENGKIWTKIAGMGAAIGGLLYMASHWLKKAF